MKICGPMEFNCFIGGAAGLITANFIGVSDKVKIGMVVGGAMSLIIGAPLRYAYNKTVDFPNPKHDRFKFEYDFVFTEKAIKMIAVGILFGGVIGKLKDVVQAKMG